MKIRARHLLLLWLLGFLSSLVVQTVFQAWFAKVTIWGRNLGWQTEIAIWNVGMSVVLVGLLQQSDSVHRAAIPGLVVLSLALGVNHLQAAISEPGQLGNWLGAGLNFSGLTLAAFYYVSRQRPAA